MAKVTSPPPRSTSIIRFAEDGEPVERGFEEPLLQDSINRGIRMTSRACSGCAA
jgi:hypothetical protein